VSVPRIAAAGTSPSTLRGVTELGAFNGSADLSCYSRAGAEKLDAAIRHLSVRCRPQEYAHDYYEVDLPLAAIEDIHDLKPLNDDIVRSLNGEHTAAMLEADVREIGYPSDAV
jgi:hypothetical protein